MNTSHFTGFTYSPAIAKEEGVTRRDPSPVINVDGLYHAWYSKSTTARHGFSATVWHATSEDGRRWTEEAEAIGRGPAGSFRACGVFTPTILTAAGKYYIYFTAMPHEWFEHPQTTRGAIGVAHSSSPFGPWEVEDAPVLQCSREPQAFDSLRVDDACIIVRGGQYWMYYKGRAMAEGADTTKMGLATAREPLGPWSKHEDNPVLDSGHEVCVWPHGTGVACLVCDVGPQGNTLQYSSDGVNFSKAANTVPPKAPGPFRADDFVDGPGPGITWGLAMVNDRTWPYLVRFDCNLASEH